MLLVVLAVVSTALLVVLAMLLLVVLVVLVMLVLVLVILVSVLVTLVVLVLVLVMLVFTANPVRWLRPSLLRLLPLTLDLDLVMVTCTERLPPVLVPPVLAPPRLVPLTALQFSRTCIRNDRRSGWNGMLCLATFVHYYCNVVPYVYIYYVAICVECAHLFIKKYLLVLRDIFFIL
ncbi:unnamed protein product [Laminaria digitata]